MLAGDEDGGEGEEEESDEGEAEIEAAEHETGDRERRKTLAQRDRDRVGARADTKGTEKSGVIPRCPRDDIAAGRAKERSFASLRMTASRSVDGAAKDGGDLADFVGELGDLVGEDGLHAVGEGAVGFVMDFDEQTIGTGGDRGAR